MKRVLILILLILSLCSCGKLKDISESLFIASIGIEKEQENLYGYFYLPMSIDIGKSDTTEGKGKGDYAKVKGSNIAELFNNITVSVSLDINFKHVSSIIISYDLLEKEFIKELTDYVKYSFDIDFNCYIFSTREKISDIFDFQNPNRESVLNSILVLSGDEKGVSLVTNPPHFLEFVRCFYDDRNIMLPLLDIEELWNIEGEQAKNFHPQNAVYYFRGNVMEVEKNISSPFMKNTDGFYEQINNSTIYFFDYKFHVNYLDTVEIFIDFNYSIYDSDSSIKEMDIIELVRKRINSYLDEFQKVDPLDMSYYSMVKQTEYSYDNLIININVLNN